MKRPIRLVAISALVWALTGTAQEPDCPAFRFVGDEEVNADDCVAPDYVNHGARLESLFSSESMQSFLIVREASALPAAVHALLAANVHFGGIAEWGEDWNTTDVVSQDRPTAQHVISFVSNRASAVVYQSGGIGGPRTNLLLTHASHDVFCVFRGAWESFPSNLSIRSLQASAQRHGFSQSDAMCREKNHASRVVR